jgi:hypothetical protein
MMRRFIVGTALAAGLALTTTGCLGDTKEKADAAGNKIKLTAAQVLGKSAEKAGQADTFSMDLNMDTQLPQGAMKMHMVIQTRLRPDVAMKMNVDSMSMAGQTIPAYEARIVGKRMYLKMPGMQQASGGKTWGRVSLSDLGDAAGGLNFDQLLDQAQQQSPADQTRMLTASKDVREVGVETVDGVKTRHFTGTVSPREALGKLDADTRAKMEGMYQQMGASPIAFDIWVGDDNLPRKMTSKLDTSGGPVSMTAVYRDYGKPVDIQAPPAGQVGDLKMPSLN